MQNAIHNTNGAQRQSSFTAQRTINGYDMNSAIPVNNHYSPAMPNTNGSFYTQQGPSQAQPHMAYSQQMANGNGQGMNHTMSIGNQPVAPTVTPQHNAQFVQQVAQPGFVGQQMINVNGGSPASNGRTQFSSATNQQPGVQFAVAHRQQLPPNYQVPQSHQATQKYQGPPQIYQSPPIQVPQAYQRGGAYITTTHYISYENPDAWNHNTPDVHQAHASDVGTTEPSQPPLGPETLREFEDRVAGLVEEKATTFKSHIRNNEADLSRHEAAVWKAKRKGDEFEDKSEGYPTTEAGLSALKQRLFNALLNVDGDQDPASDTDDIANCLAMRTIKGLSDLEVEIVTQKLLNDTLEVQRGDALLNLQPESKIVQEPNFTVKFNNIETALKFNKLLCRSATSTAEWVSRIAADPVGERKQKRANTKNNKKKNTVLKKEAKKNGTSRPIKGKRAAPADTEAAAEAPEAVPSSSEGRPTKRMRTAKQPQAGQAQVPHEALQQQIQVAAVGPTVAYSSPNRVDLAQGVAGLVQGAFIPSGQPNNLNHNPSDQIYQATNFANGSLNHNGFVQSEQQNHTASSFVDLTQVDGTNHSAHDAAVTARNERFFGPQQTQPDASQGIWTEFVSNLGMEAMDFEIPIDPVLQGSAGMANIGHSQHQISIRPEQNQQVLQSQQSTQSPQSTQSQQLMQNQEAARHQQLILDPQAYAHNQQVMHNQQPGQEHADQQQATEGDPTQQVDDDDLFGEFTTMLGPLAEYNAQN